MPIVYRIVSPNPVLDPQTDDRDLDRRSIMSTVSTSI
jgi:hypothetical protein